MSAPSDLGLTPLPRRGCPRCGGPNDCTPAATGRFDGPCWCSSVQADRAVLAALPADARGCACLCRRCLTGIVPVDGGDLPD